MKINHCVSVYGHFVTIKTDKRELTVLTENGKPEELEKYAAELRTRAARISRQAELVDQATREMRSTECEATK